jgi:hypothetical protein
MNHCPSSAPNSRVEDRPIQVNNLLCKAGEWNHYIASLWPSAIGAVLLGVESPGILWGMIRSVDLLGYCTMLMSWVVAEARVPSLKAHLFGSCVAVDQAIDGTNSCVWAAILKAGP